MLIGLLVIQALHLLTPYKVFDVLFYLGITLLILNLLRKK
jgi:hypothetical protein